MRLWLLIGVIAGMTVLIKAAGPVLLGGRPLPPRAMVVIATLPPVLLAALVVTSTFADGQRVRVDASTVGVCVAGVLLWRGRPVVLAVLVAAVVTATIRALA